MQPECASEGVTLIHGRTSESLYTAPSAARFKPGSAHEDHTRAGDLTWGTRGEIPGAPPANPATPNLGRPYFTGTLLRNPADSLSRQVPLLGPAVDIGR